MNYTTQKQLRDAFWENHPEFDLQARQAGTRGKRQNSQPVDIRVAWCDFIDYCLRNGDISDELAEKAVL